MDAGSVINHELAATQISRCPDWQAPRLRARGVIPSAHAASGIRMFNDYLIYSAVSSTLLSPVCRGLMAGTESPRTSYPEDLNRIEPQHESLVG